MVLSVVWMRAQWDPEADSIGLVVAAHAWQAFWLMPAFAMRGRRMWPEERRPSRPEEAEEEAAPPRVARG